MSTVISSDWEILRGNPSILIAIYLYLYIRLARDY